MIRDTKFPSFGLHDSLVIPIGAKSIASIEKFVGPIEKIYGNDEAVAVRFEPLALPNDLPVWQFERSYLLGYSLQLWIDVDSRNYRYFYLDLFEHLAVDDHFVIDHIMNRKLARELGYKFVRLLHVSRSVNSSSGRGAETVANEFLPITMRVNPEVNISEIVYADASDLLKMLNMNTGGFGLDEVRDSHYLFYQ